VSSLLQWKGAGGLRQKRREKINVKCDISDILPNVVKDCHDLLGRKDATHLTDVYQWVHIMQQLFYLELSFVTSDTMQFDSFHLFLNHTRN